MLSVLLIEEPADGLQLLSLIPQLYVSVAAVVPMFALHSVLVWKMWVAFADSVNGIQNLS